MPLQGRLLDGELATRSEPSVRIPVFTRPIHSLLDAMNRGKH